MNVDDVEGVMRRIIVACWICFFFTTGVAFADEMKAINPGISMDESMLAMEQAGFSAVEIGQVRDMAAAAQQQGIPIEPLASKVQEGIIKQVPASLVVRVVARVSARYGFAFATARELTRDPAAQAQLGLNLAAALAAGVSEQDLAGMVGQLHGKDQSVVSEAAAALRDIARQGVSSATATGLVGRAVSSGASASEIGGLRGSMRDQTDRSSAESLAQGYAAGLDQGLGLDAMGQTEGGVGMFGGVSGGMGGESSGGAAGSDGGDSGGGGSGGGGSGGGGGGGR